MKKIKRAVGSPDNSVFIRRCIIYGILLGVMLFVAPTVFAKLMVPMAASGIRTAWYAVFVPIAAIMMAVGLFLSFRRRYPLAYMKEYNEKARRNGYEYCPRCGARLVLKKRTRYVREKTGELVTTTTYSDGSQNVDRKDVYESVKRTSYYYECTDRACRIEVDQSLGQSHLPWRKKQIRALVCEDDSLLDEKHPTAASLLTSRLLAPILAILLTVVCAILVYAYADRQDGEWSRVSADKAASRSEAAYTEYLLTQDTENKNWHVSYEKSPTDMMSYLGEKIGIDKAKGYAMGSYTYKDGTVLYFDFEGYDAGLGIPDGRYTLTELDGVNVLIVDEEETIYKEGTEYYTALAPKLLSLSHDAEAQAVLARVAGGEHAISGTSSFQMEFLRKDDSTVFSYLRANDPGNINGEFRAVTLYPALYEQELWIFSYDNNEYVPDGLEGYVYSDASPEGTGDALDELIKASSEGRGDYELYRGDVLVLEVDVERLVNGYEFSFDTVAEGALEGFKEGDLYRINTTQETLTKIVFTENYLREEVDLPLSEHKETYDYLLSIAPESYIRRIIDLDKAEVQTEKLGLIKNYVMKDESGNVTAELKVMFGKIGEVIHHTGEGEYVKIELAY